MNRTTGKRYRSKYEAYPFLQESNTDLRCDFEIATDEFASEVGLLAVIIAQHKEEAYHQIYSELLKITELVYHANPTLRTFFSVTDEELDWLLERTVALGEQIAKQESMFQLPRGCEVACRAHILRSKAKALVRLCYRAEEVSQLSPPEKLYDFLNVLSGYFYRLALRLNQLANVAELPYFSRNYKS